MRNRSRRSWASNATAIACLGSALAGAPLFALAADAKAKAHTVVIDGVKYEPASLTVKRGETVTWINKDPIPHTVTAAGTFDSKEIAPGKSWKYVARKVGDYDYICTLHPNMKGTLKVE
ncbi:MAG: cupredoxin family copper-binding protein [Bacillota bacterium]